jgi:hypothetical protein
LVVNFIGCPCRLDGAASLLNLGLFWALLRGSGSAILASVQ